jgi:hypothetical protein
MTYMTWAQPSKPEGWESRFLSERWSARAALYRLAANAWNAGLTPGGVIRALGPWGPGLVKRYVAGRFSMHGAAAQPMHESARTCVLLRKRGGG